MASSMLTGDRRWTPARKSGMTVLGKVPKPINLPSQRLENHGLDPNVEIVPKGTLTWGSRPSSAAPNAWASSTLSTPNTDGSAVSSNRLNGRPSSGGSGTRPSTAGSDRSLDPLANAWGPNSRPSSASGLLASNQTSMAASRPRSAETRPGSSQLSRFAEPGAETSVAWGATGTVDRLGPPQTNGFSLSSGDFPTLGSEKNSELHVQQGHSFQGRPSSASGGVATQKERMEHPPNGDETVGSCLGKKNVDTRKTDTSPCTGGGVPPNIENWHRDPQQAQPFPNVNMPPHQFGPWRGPPIQNSSDGVWYRGGPTGGPYRPAGPPGSYPVEPFAYYAAQLPARPIPNSQSGPRPGAILRGYPPMNGEPYRPYMPPDSYMVPTHPVIPVRPGAYPGPVPYDGYYGPPRATFCNSNERETRIIGMAAQACVYNQHPTHLDTGNFHARPGGYAPTMANEQIETGHVHDTHGGQYKVLLKQNDGWEDYDPEEKKGPSVTSSMPHLVNAHCSGASTHEDDLGANGRKEEPKAFAKLDATGSSSQPASGLPGHSSISVVANMPEISCKAEAVDDSQVKKLENAAIPAEDAQHYPTKKNATLIEKIEGLNSKARIADGHYDVPVSVREEKTKQFKIVNTKVDHSTKVIYTTAIFHEKAPSKNAPTSGIVIPSNIMDNSRGDNLESNGAGKVVSGTSELQAFTADMSDSSKVEPKVYSQINKRAHGMQGRPDNHARLRFNSQDSEEWRKKSPGAGRDSSPVAIVTNADYRSAVHVQDCHASQEESEKQELLHVTKVGDEPYMTSSVDSIDYKAQRAKMKEIATQRAKQLQKEEEERIREQKAKALAKLEELNRRMLAENSNQVLDRAEPLSDATQHKQESKASSAQKTNAIIGEALGCTSCPNSDAVVQQRCGDANKLGELTVMHMSDSGTDKLGESIDSSAGAALESSKYAPQSVIPHNPSLSPRQNVPKIKVSTDKSDSQLYDNSAPKQKQMGHRRRQNISQDKNPGEKAVTDGNTEEPKSVDGVVTCSVPSGDNLPNSPNDHDDHSVQPKRRNNRGARNKNKLEEASLGSALTSSAHNKGNLEKTPTESDKTKSSGSVIVAISVPAHTSIETVGIQSSGDVVITSSNQGLPQSTEEAHGKSTNQWKPQQPRRTTRNLQAVRALDKFNGTEAAIWAPVRPLNKNELSEEVLSTASETNNHSSGKDVNDVQNNLKSKRAEMERYVPKPAARELSQQDRQPSPSRPQAAYGEKTAKSEMGSQGISESGKLDGLTCMKGIVAVETKSGDNSKPNKHGRTHASWRQRGSNESSPSLQSSYEGSSSFNAKTFEKPSDQQKPSKLGSSQKGQPKCSDDEWNTDNSNLMPGESVTVPAAVKDYGVTSRGRRQPVKGNRAVATNFAPGEAKGLQRGTADRTDIQSVVLESNEPGGKNASKADSQNCGEHSRSHWQPKSQAYSTHNNRQGNQGSGGQSVPSQSGKFDKESPSKDTSCHPLQTYVDNTMTQRSGVAEIRNTCHQEANKERKVRTGSLREETHFQNQDFSTTAELAFGNVDPQFGQPVSSGLRRQGQHNGHFNRGQEITYGGGRGLGRDSVKQNIPSNGDQRKHYSHYEYQRIGSYSKPKDTFQQNTVVGDEGQDGSHATASRYKERGQNHSRRGGHFYGRNSGAVRVGEAYGSGE